MITVALKPIQRRNAQPDKGDYVMVNWRISAHPHGWRPPTDVYEKDEGFVVRVEIAGMNERDFNINLDQNVLSIQGVRADISERRAYHQMEINFGEFMILVELPVPIDTETVSAEYQNGFLRIVLPKAQAKVIKIKDNE